MAATFTNFFIFGKDAFTKTAKASPWRDDDQCERAFMSYFKAAGLMLLIHLAFAGVGWSIAGKEGALIGTLIALGFHIVVFWYAEKIMLKLHNAREVGSDDASPMIRAFVADCDRLAMRANMPRPRTYIVDAFQPNAFVAGRDTNHASIAVTDGLLKTLTRTAEGYNLYNVASGVISLLVMFPAAFCAGMTLPLLTLVLLRQGGGERVIGRVYAVNTLGAIVGVLAAVLATLPALAAAKLRLRRLEREIARLKIDAK